MSSVAITLIIGISSSYGLVRIYEPLFLALDLCEFIYSYNNPMGRCFLILTLKVRNQIHRGSKLLKPYIMSIGKKELGSRQTSSRVTGPYQTVVVCLNPVTKFVTGI
jgi:hypothetical protein